MSPIISQIFLFFFFEGGGQTGLLVSDVDGCGAIGTEDIVLIMVDSLQEDKSKYSQ